MPRKSSTPPNPVAIIQAELAQVKAQLTVIELQRGKLSAAAAEYETTLRVLLALKARNQPNASNTDDAASDAASSANSQGSDSPRRKRRKFSMAAIIRDIALAQAGEFTPTVIADEFRSAHPDLWASLPAGYPSSQCWKLAEARVIEVVSRGGAGGVNVYRVPGRKRA